MGAHIPFYSLPLRKDGPPGNAWGRFGDDDQLGTLNFLTPENTKKALREITDGTRISTDWPLGSMARPCFGRKPLEHTINQLGSLTANDDFLHFNTQSSSQWDGFRHCGYLKEAVYYNGMTQDEVQTTTRNGTQAWVENGGIAGRGVLIDYAAWCDAKGETPEFFSKTSIKVSTLQAIANEQGVSFQRGDILFVRSGWMRAYQNLSNQEKDQVAAQEHPPSIGLESSEETLRWIWDNGFAAAAGDHPTLEAWPCFGEKVTLHEWMLGGWGCPIGELFDLERLSEECKKRKKYSFFFSSMPLNVPGGVASPPNGMAIF